MIKRPFLVFCLVLSVLIGGLLWYIQSPQFAKMLKAVTSRYIPKGTGIEADFSEFSVKLFPPGFSVKNPQITVQKGNFAKLPGGSSLVAERIDFSFLPFQILSGEIRIDQVAIVNGRLDLLLDESTLKSHQKQKTKQFGFHWDDIVHVKVKSIILQNLKVGVQFVDSKRDIQGTIETASLDQWNSTGKLGYQLNLDLKEIHGEYLKQFSLPEKIDQIHLQAGANVLGLQLEALKISSPGFLAFVSGKLKGDFLKSSSLLVDGKISLKSDFNQLSQMYPKTFTASNTPTGRFEFDGKFEGNPLKLLETAQASGSLNLDHFTYQNWKAEKIQAEIQWAPSSSGGEFTLKKASIISPERPRTGAFQPGEGGRIEMGQVKWTLGSTARVVVPLRFENAHVHWLGAPASKKLFPLNLKLNGNILLGVTPPSKNQSWRIDANLKTWVDQFQLDNQKFQRVKPLAVVFKIPKIFLNGNLLINSNGVYPQNLELSLPRSKLNLNGSIDFNRGYDLRAGGVVNFEDMGQIASNPIAGQGPIQVHVHGPAAKVFVDVDVDVKNGAYLNLAFGDVKGRVTWEDDPNLLHLSHMEFTKGVSHYKGNGKLDLGLANTIDLNIQVPKGDIQDFIQVMSHLIRDISWFPKSLNGPVEGDVKVSGGVSLSKIKILSQLKGNNWEYQGERFKSVKIAGGYDCGKYLISDLNAIKRFGQIQGNISVDADGKIDWSLVTEGFTLNDLDYFVLLDIPIRGRIQFESEGHTIANAIESNTQFHLVDLTIRGLGMLPSQFSLKTHAGAAKARGVLMGGQASMETNYDFNPKEISSVHAEFKQLDFSPLLLLLNPRSVQDKNLAGNLSGSFNLSFHSQDFARSNGMINLTGFMLSRSGARFQLEQPIFAKVFDGTFDIRDLTAKGERGRTVVNLSGEKGKLRGKIDGDLDINLLEFLTPTIAQASGLAKLNLDVEGTTIAPSVSGRIKLDGGTLRVASLESPFENVNGILNVKKGVVNAQNIQAELGGGKITAGGQVTFNHDQPVSLDLKAMLNGPKIKIYPFQYAKVNGTIAIVGSELPYSVNGNIIVESALSKEKVLSQKKSGAGFKAIQYAPPPTKQGETRYSKFKLNIKVDAQRGVQIQNDLFKDVQAKANLTIVNTLDAPRIIGTAEIIQGKLLFKDHVFQIQSASANFDNPTVINPSFDMNANTEINGIKIQMYATGRIDKPKFELTSNPAMQDTEILSLLAVGFTSTDAKRINSNDLNTMQQSEAASLVLHSLDFNRELEDKTGFQVQLDESVNRLQGVNAFSPQSQSAASVAPQVTIRKKLGDRLSLSAGSTVGAGTNKSNQINLDLSVTSNLSIMGIFNNYGTSGTSENMPSTNSIGLDLKFQRRFK